MRTTLIILLLSTLNVDAQIQWSNTEQNHLGLFINPTFDEPNIQIGLNYAWYYESGQFAELNLSVTPYEQIISVESILSYGGVLEHGKFNFLFGGRLGINYRGTFETLEGKEYKTRYNIHFISGLLTRLDYNIYEELHLGIQLTTDFNGYYDNNPIRYNSAVIMSYKF